MVFIDLEYGMDENWPKSFAEVYWTRKYQRQQFWIQITPSTAKLNLRWSKMTIIDLEYGLDKNWPKFFPEAYWTRKYQ